MTNEKKYDRRRKYYMILDCETATLPYAANYSGEAKKKIAIAKPLIYDLAWQIVDRKGNVYSKKSFLITEIFSVPSVFNTAYYADKRPLYLEKLNKGEIELKTWKEAAFIFLSDLGAVEAVGAYNSMFDFKKAIPFTERYINALYSPNYSDWEIKQQISCDRIATGKQYESNRNFDAQHFIFRDEKYPLFDIWGMACNNILNCDEYKYTCIENNWRSPSGKYFPTNAEKAFSFFSGNHDFIESHTALEDAEIETELFAHMVRKDLKKLVLGIEYFPFRVLGKVENFCCMNNLPYEL